MLKSGSAPIVLLVTADNAAARFVADALEAAGFSVMHLQSEEAAPGLAADAGPSLALVDLGPEAGLDGLAAARGILATRRSIPLLFLFGATPAETIAAAEELAPSAFLPRDASPAVLNASIRTTLRIHAERLDEIERRARLTVAADNIHGVLYAFDPELRFVLSRGAGLAGLDLAPDQVVGVSLYEFLQTDDPQNEIIAAHLRALQGESVRYESSLGDAIFTTRVTPIRNDAGEVIGVAGISLDTAERKRIEAEREELLHELNERVKELQCMYAVAESLQTRESVDEMLQDAATLLPAGWQYPEIACGRVRFDGSEYVSHSFRVTEWKQSAPLIVNGEARGAVEVHYMEERPQQDEGPFAREERLLINGLASTIGKALERREAGRQLHEALQQNRELLRELQHRAKNSFAMISGMIDLAREGSESEDAHKALGEIDSKVRALSEMYSLLYSSGATAEVRLDEYLQRIVEALPPSAANVRMICECDRLVLSIESAVNICLIAAEWITNAHKHAFPDRRDGVIALTLRLQSGGARLEVADNGVGFPEDFALTKSGSLGMQLARNLAARSGGKLRIDREEWTRCILEFPVELPERTRTPAPV